MAIVRCVLFFLFFSVAAIEANVPNITIFQGSLEKVVGDKEEIDLIKHFPFSYYKKYEIKGLGSFYLDSRIDIIKNELRAGRRWEQEIVDLLQAHIKPGTVAIDIGAHIGTHALSMSKFVGAEGKVVAFEPQKKLFSELVMNMTLNSCSNVHAYRCAVGKGSGTIEMDSPVADNEGGIGFGSGGDNAPIISLDSLELSNVSLMKIDVENFEYQVLLGAEKTIRKSMPYIIVEIMGNIYKPIPDRDTKVKKTVSFLENLGYRLQYIKGSWSDWLAIPPEKVQEKESTESIIDVINQQLKDDCILKYEIPDIIEAHVKAGTTAVDIGASSGGNTVTMSEVTGKEGHVYAFEPRKKLFSELVTNMTLNECRNVTAYNCAIGDQSSAVEIREGDSEAEIAPMITLDSLNLNNVSLVKVDAANLEYLSLIHI